MSHSAENFRKGILLFLRKFLVSKSLMDEKGVSRFSVENFWSHSAEKFRGHPFNVSEILGYQKILCRIGVITSFRRKIFVSQCRKISWASLQCLRNFGVSKNFMQNRSHHKFPSKNFCLTVPKNFVGIPSMFQKIWAKILCIIGGITIFRRVRHLKILTFFKARQSCVVVQKVQYGP